MTVTIHVPAVLRSYCGGAGELFLSAPSVRAVLEQIEHGHHVVRACAKNAVLRMCEKFSTFLRVEVLSNNLRDLGLKKSLANLDSVRQTLAPISLRSV